MSYSQPTRKAAPLQILAALVLIGAGLAIGQILPPVFEGGLYKLTVANITMTVDPNTAGRITSLKLHGSEVLYTDKSNGNINWGSTFWPSPQYSWGWPPPHVLDIQAYTGGIENNAVVLTSNNDHQTGLTLKKYFSANAPDTSFTIRYTMTNSSGGTRQYAPWEITRVPSGGFTFYPQGAGSMSGDLSRLTSTYQGISWFDYDSTTIPQGVPKLFSDGSEGWLAHLNHSRIILIKKFPDVPALFQAPGEAEIEIYTDPQKRYLEVEQQGFYTTFNTGDSLLWEVKWFLRKLPAALTGAAADPELVSYTRALAAGLPLSLKEKRNKNLKIKIRAGYSGLIVNLPYTGNVIIQIFNNRGKIVHTFEQTAVYSTRLHLPAFEFSAGIYFLRIRMEGKKVTPEFHRFIHLN